MQQLDSSISEPLGDAQVSSILSCSTPEPLPADARDTQFEAPDQPFAAELLRGRMRGLRGIPWRRQSHVRWNKLIEQAIWRIQWAALDPSNRWGVRLFPDSTPLPGPARDGRSRDERERSVRIEARTNTANVLSVILGWADIASGLVAEKPKAGRAGGWKHKSWTDVGAMAFGFEDIEGALCVEKRTARAVDRLEDLGFVQVTQIREPTPDRESWRSRTAVKRVTQQLWAALGLIKEFFAVLNARKRERAEQQKSAREAVQYAGERARQAPVAPARTPVAMAQTPRAVKIDEGPPPRWELPACVGALNEALGIA